jgi:hypothetical protein
MTVSEEERGKRRPNIWFYRIEKEKQKDMKDKKLVYNLVEIIILLGELKEFQHIQNITYKTVALSVDSYVQARKRKSDK